MSLKKKEDITPKRKYNTFFTREKIEKINKELFSADLVCLFAPLFKDKKNSALAEFCNAAVWRFLKFLRKSLWRGPSLIKFQIFKMHSAADVFLSDSLIPLYGCFKALNWNTSLWVITLFSVNISDSSDICQKVIACSY